MTAKKPTLRDLVYLKFASNDCYINVTERKPSGIELNLEEGTWSLGGYTQKIGREKPVNTYATCHNQIIGVYDRRDTSQLSLMVHTVTEIIRRRSRRAVDVD